MAKPKRQPFTTRAPGKRKSKAKRLPDKSPKKPVKGKLTLDIRITDLPKFKAWKQEIEQRLRRAGV